MRARLHALAMTDDLTGLHNLRSFEARLAHDGARCARASRAPLALLVLDVDRLKSLNDTHGHLAGAEAVRTVGPHHRGAAAAGGGRLPLRRRRVRGRAAPLHRRRSASAIADDSGARCNDTAPVLAGMPFPGGDAVDQRRHGVPVWRHTTELGTRDDDEAGEALFRAADAALYRAKAGGRNHVSVA